MSRPRNAVIDIITVPYGTRLNGLALSDEGEVHVWIANKDRSVPYEQWEGTFIRIEPNGRVTRVTRESGIIEEIPEMVIREPFKS